MKKVTTKSEKTTTEKAPVQPEVPQFEQKDRRGEVIKTNRFVIRKTLVGLGVLIEFTNKKGVSWRYDHDEVFTRTRNDSPNKWCGTNMVYTPRHTMCQRLVDH